MNITHENYPDVSKYVATWKKIIEYAKSHPEDDLQLPQFNYKTVTELRREFWVAMNHRINIRGGCKPVGKKDCIEYDVKMFRDKIALENKLQRRIRIYYFETSEVKKRFSHLLSSYNEY